MSFDESIELRPRFTDWFTPPRDLYVFLVLETRFWTEARIDSFFLLTVELSFTGFRVGKALSIAVEFIRYLELETEGLTNLF